MDHTRQITALMAMAVMSAMPLTNPNNPRVRRVRRGNKYALCQCGSYKPWANCCGQKKEVLESSTNTL